MARERARTSCPRRDSRRRILAIHSGGIHTASSSPVHNSLASVRASSRSVFARACEMPVSPGETTMTLLTCGSSSLTISRELPVTSSATRSVGNRLSASVSIPSGVAGTRPAEYTLPSSQIAISMKSRCTSSPTHRPNGRDSNRLLTAHLLQLVVLGWDGERVGERHRPIRARSAPGQVAGAATEKHGLEAHRPKRRARLRSPQQESPVPGDPLVRGRAGDSCRTDFHAPTNDNLASPPLSRGAGCTATNDFCTERCQPAAACLRVKARTRAAAL